ncbi:MAG TPA: GNAT family protein [Terriglobales bacterium]
MIPTIPPTLAGRRVRLEPLSFAHEIDLAHVHSDLRITQWFHQPIHDMHAFIEEALSQQAAGASLPYATVDIASGKAIGSTRFHDIDRKHRKTAIGWTWIAPEFQRTYVNTEAKFIMLSAAFDTWGCIRVELRTDSLNQQSRAAIARLGAVEEGTLRNHMITASGRIRHSVYFSITQEEWPGVKSNLESKLRA